MNKKILYEIYITCYEWIEKGVSFNARDMFKLFFKKDVQYRKYAPKAIHKDMAKFETFVNILSDNERSKLQQFVSCCVDLYNYDLISNKRQSLEQEKLYYNSALAQYYVMGILTKKNFDFNVLKKFIFEFNQVSLLITQYYNAEQDKRAVISRMINSKTNELFKRYDFNYSLPLCAR